MTSPHVEVVVPDVVHAFTKAHRVAIWSNELQRPLIMLIGKVRHPPKQRQIRQTNNVIRVVVRQEDRREVKDLHPDRIQSAGGVAAGVELQDRVAVADAHAGARQMRSHRRRAGSGNCHGRRHELTAP